MAKSFDEFTLRADIARVFGEHGAHVELFDAILRRAQPTDEQIRGILWELDHFACEANQYEMGLPIEEREYALPRMVKIVRDGLARTIRPMQS